MFEGLDAVERIRLNYNLVGALVSLMFLDIAFGILNAIKKRELSSVICREGMVRKVGMFFFICVMAVIEPLTNGIPAVQVSCMCFVIYEAISVIEKAKRIGVPIPDVITDVIDGMKNRTGLLTKKGRKDDDNEPKPKPELVE